MSYAGHRKRTRLPTGCPWHKESTVCSVTADLSVVAKHTLSMGHQISFDQTQVVLREHQYQERIYTEAIEIYKHHNTMNRIKVCRSRS